MVLAAASGGGTLWWAQQPTAGGLSRLRARLPGQGVPASRPASPGRSSGSGTATRRLTCAAAALSIVLVVPGPLGWLGGVAAAVGLGRWLAGVPGRGELAADAAVRRQLPLALTLMAAALSSGATVPAAVGLAARGSGAELRALLLEVAASLALGAQPAEAWSTVAAGAGRPTAGSTRGAVGVERSRDGAGLSRPQRAAALQPPRSKRRWRSSGPVC